MNSAYDLRAKYTHFRILVIGRANAGKTTLLKRVCNTDEDPCIYDADNNNLIEPTSERGIHNINVPFAFRNTPGFVFHDSPGFETGDAKQLEEVLSFLAEKSKSTEVKDQLHAIWFCFVLNSSRPLLLLEIEFFQKARAGNVPVIAIFTKFDDLVTQIYNMDLDNEDNRQNAKQEVENKFSLPLSMYDFPPRAYVCLEALHDNAIGKHQDQVNDLIEKTAASLDNISLKMLFVSVQQNNIELCIYYAIEYNIRYLGDISLKEMAVNMIQWFGHSFIKNYNYGKTEEKQFRIPIHQIPIHQIPIHQIPIQFFQDFRQQRLDQIVQALSPFLENFYQFNPLFKSYFPRWLYQLFIFSAILICIENTFWNQDIDGNFVELFKRSFSLYSESGIKMKVEVALAELVNGKENINLDTKYYKEEIYNIVLNHGLSHPKNKSTAYC